MATRVLDAQALTPRRLRAALKVTPARMARLLGVDEETITEWERSDEPPTDQPARDRFEQLQLIVHLCDLVYEPEGFDLFMTTPMPVFGGRTALDLIEHGQGQRVVGALAQDYEGLGY